MRLSVRKSAGKERGSVAVLIMIAVPLMVVMLALAIDLGRIAVARARLEAAADRAAYVGAVVLADALNEISFQNWRIYKDWRNLVSEFGSDSQQTKATSQRRIASFKRGYDVDSENIREIQDEMPARANAYALNLLAANAPNSTGRTVLPGGVFLSDSEEQEQDGHVDYSYVTGTDYLDPTSVETKSYDHKSYLVKPKGPDATIGVLASETIRPMLLGKFFDHVEISASAAAQAFGGSVRNFALKATDTVSEARDQISAEGSDELYHAALVPMWTLGAGYEEMRH
ncbi:MAG: Tad domain-containing protein [Pseudomonadota bacterium]